MKRVQLGLTLLFLFVGVLLVNTSVANPAVNQTNASQAVITQDLQDNGAVVANYMTTTNAPADQTTIFTFLQNDYSNDTANSTPVPEVATVYIGNYVSDLAIVMINPLNVSAGCRLNNQASTAFAPEVAYNVICHTKLAFSTTNYSPANRILRV